MITKDEIKELLQSTETYRMERAIIDVPCYVLSLSQVVPSLSQVLSQDEEQVASSIQKVVIYKKIGQLRKWQSIFWILYHMAFYSRKQKEVEA